MSIYGCRSCVRRFSVASSGPAHTRHAAFCPFCGSSSINDLSVKVGETESARSEVRARETTRREI